MYRSVRSLLVVKSPGNGMDPSMNGDGLLMVMMMMMVLVSSS